MPPHVLVHADDLHAVEPGRILDQDPLPLGEDGIVGGVPGHREPFGDAGDGQVLNHQTLQCPPQTMPGQLRPRLGRLARVLAPHVPAPSAPVAADDDLQRRRPPPQRFVRQPPDHAVTSGALAAAAPAPPIRFHDPARQNRTTKLQPLPDDLQAELAETAERGQVRANEGSVRHVEVFLMGGVRTPILGRPRPLPGDRRAVQHYTVNCEEPH
jgi:hypothetical protein